jgi:hypothetical protein
VVIDLTSLPVQRPDTPVSSRAREFTGSSQPGIPDNPSADPKDQENTFVPVDPAGVTG